MNLFFAARTRQSNDGLLVLFINCLVVIGCVLESNPLLFILVFVKLIGLRLFDRDTLEKFLQHHGLPISSMELAGEIAREKTDWFPQKSRFFNRVLFQYEYDQVKDQKSGLKYWEILVRESFCGQQAWALHQQELG